MKHTMLLLLILCGIRATSQIAASDAVKLKNLSANKFDPAGSGKICLPQSEDVLSILKKYMPPSNAKAPADFKNEFNTNPFIFYCAIPFGGNISTGGNPLFSAIGGLDVTNIADALARFLVKRTKQELTIAFFDRFKDYIKKYPDLRSVFPNTYLAFTLVDNQIYDYQGYIQTLRESFQKDLDVLYKNLPSIVDNHTRFFEMHRRLEAALRSGCYVAEALKEKVHPGQILNDYPADYLDHLNLNLKGALQTLQLFSSSLRDSTFESDSANYWISAKQIKQLVNDKITFQIYLGLIYQQARMFNVDSNGVYTPIKFRSKASDTITLNVILDAAAKNLNPVREFITALSTKTEKLNVLIRNYKKPASDSLAIELYQDYFEASLDLLKQCAKITQIPVVKNRIKDDFTEEMNDYFGVTQSASNIVLDIARKNYSSAVVNAVHIYDIVVISKENVHDSLASKQEALTGLFKYGSFMAAVVQAKSSDEIENVIEAFALPQGSSRIKRASAFNVSLNGYAGLFYGHEFISGIKDKHTFNSYGVTAPIGVATSAGLGKGWSGSLFLSVIDLGAVAAYRIKNDTIAQVPTIRLRDIFAPGAFLSLGFPKSPLSFNFGAQVGPNLRKVSDKNTYSNKTYVRLSASLCVDIPLLNLYTKPR